MYWPTPITEQVKTPAAILTGTIGIGAFGFGVYQYGWTGLLAALGVVAVGLIATLWAESARLQGIIDSQRDAIARADETGTNAEQEMAELRAGIEQVAVLEDRLEDRDGRIRDLTAQLRQPEVTNESLLEGVAALISAVDLRTKHRALAAPEWPVVRADLREVDEVTLSAVVANDDASRFAQEPVVLVDDAAVSVSRGAIIFAEGAEIVAAFALSTLPWTFEEELEGSGTFSPSGHRLRLLGEDLFSAEREEQVIGLRTAAVTLAAKLDEVMSNSESGEISGGLAGREHE